MSNLDLVAELRKKISSLKSELAESREEYEALRDSVSDNLCTDRDDDDVDEVTILTRAIEHASTVLGEKDKHEIVLKDNEWHINHPWRCRPDVSDCDLVGEFIKYGAFVPDAVAPLRMVTSRYWLDFGTYDTRIERQNFSFTPKTESNS